MTMAVPSADEEIWRYSRIAEFDPAGFVPGRARTETVGVDAFRADGAGPAAHEPADAFAALNAAGAEAITLRIPPGAAAGILEVVHHVEAPGILACPRLVVDAGRDAEVTVVERFVSADGVRSVVVPVLDVRAAEGARVTYVSVNELGDATWIIANQGAEAQRDSTVRLNSVALGGDYARVRAEVRLVGQGASAEQIALYLAGGTQMHDFRTIQRHLAPRTRSDLLFKGAVAGSARSVYTGLIHISGEAAHSEAFQTNRNLTLGEGAWAQSVPNLEIETNEVKCSHASTVGSIDEEQRFYLESRGVPPEAAERLIVFGFFDDVLDRFPRGVDVEGTRRAVAAKLSAESR